MADLGIKPDSGKLYLTTGADFVWNYDWDPDEGDPSEYPAGSELDLLLGADQVFPFTIDGATAAIKIESEICDLIADRTPFRIRFTDATTPTTEEIPLIGIVQRVDPRGL